MSGKNSIALTGKDNGKAGTPTAETKTANTNSAPGATPEPTAQTTQQPPNPETQKGKAKTRAEIIAKTEKVNSLIEGLEKLDEAYKKLDGFDLGNPRLRCTLTITDSRDNDFETFNDFLLNSTVEHLKKSIEKRTAEMEQQLTEIESQ